jgi:type IV pilus assembly protein PilM
MAFMGKSGGAATIGLDIGTSFIKMVELRGGRGAFTLSAVGIAPTPPGAIESGVIIAPQEIGIAIRQIMGENGFGSKRVVSSVAGQSALVVRIIEVPQMSGKELAQTMKWEVERHVPFAANEVFMDFAPLPPDPTKQAQGNMEVLLAVAQETLINTHLEVLTTAGLDPIAIDVEPLASARALVNIDDEGPSTRTVAVVNIGAGTTDFSIVKNGLLVFPRSLPIAGNTFTKAIADVMNRSIDQAEKLKKEKAQVIAATSPAATRAAARAAPTMDLGLGEAAQELDVGADAGVGVAPVDFGPAPSTSFDLDEGEDGADHSGPVKPKDLRMDAGAQEGDKYSPIPAAPVPQRPAPEPDGLDELDTAVPVTGDREAHEVFAAIRPVLDDLAKEIRRSLDYFRSRSTGDQVDEMYICGGTAKMPGLAKFLEDDLGIPVSVADPLAHIEVGGKRADPAYVKDVASLLPVALGLAMRDMLAEPADLVAAGGGKKK